MEEAISRAEHEEFRCRMEEHNERQDKRISILEGIVKEISELTASVERLVTNMEHMVKEQEAQGKCLQALEGRDGERWHQVIGYGLSAAVGALATWFLRGLGG